MSEKIIHNIAYFAFLVVAGIIIGWTVTYIQTYLSSVQDYFVYESVEPTQEYFEAWEPIFFVSKIDRKQATQMKYVDILRCDLWEWFVWYSSAVTYAKILNVWPIQSIRQYQAWVPTSWYCYLDAQPTAILRFGIEKTQKIKSSVFEIK